MRMDNVKEFHSELLKNIKSPTPDNPNADQENDPVEKRPKKVEQTNSPTI